MRIIKKEVKTKNINLYKLNEKEMIELLNQSPDLLTLDILKHLLNSQTIEINDIWKIVQQNKQPEIIKYFINQHEFEKRENWKEFEDVLNAYDIKYLYHITHRDNLENIEKYGGLFSWKMCEQLEIPVKEFGGNELSRRLDKEKKLQYFVRIGFNYNLPMFKNRIKQGNMIVLEIKRDVIHLQKTFFSDMNANSNDAIVGNNLEDFKRIDFNVACSNYSYINYGNYIYDHVQAEVLTSPFLQYKMINRILEYVRY